MRICKVCGYELEKNEMVCPFCNTPYSESSEKKTETTQSDKPLTELMKFVEFMDDDLLLKTAECKLAGIGVSKNEEEAIMLFKVLAFRGNLDGMYKFAEMCQKMGDKESAIKWLKAAADGGHKPSKIKLKMEYGEDVKINQNISLDNSTIATGFASIVKAVMPNIVMVQATGKVKGQQYNYIGSGFIIEGNYIVTNAHV
ncbi:MAG: hypothetical protein K5765_02900, partial [Clostridia bacterium]|nr:hypothetical protein [Clostridia bacterium]